jgi:tetratricopeptide (TPR) repeat protein/SAM-dependent methyltransferase
MSKSASKLFSEGLQRHQSGDIAGARRRYEEALALDPAHAQSLHHLGIIATQNSRHDLAVQLISRAIGINDRVPDFHYNIGVAFGGLGHLDKAIEHNRKAIKLKPSHAGAHMNLGKALLAVGQANEAVEVYRRVVALAPREKQAALGLANALAKAGRIDDAISQYRKILAFGPRDAVSHRNLGQSALSTGDLPVALGALSAAWALDRTSATQELLIAALNDFRALPHAMRYRDLLIDLMAETSGDRAHDLTTPAISALESNPVFARCLARASAGASAFNEADIKALADDALLLAVLNHDRACSILFERFLAAMRAALLQMVLTPGATDADASVLNMQCALARYCFQVEYVFALSDREIEQLHTVRSAIVDAENSSPAGTRVPSMLMAAASYVPLHTLPDATRLAQRAWPEPVEAVIAQQIREPLEVAKVAATIPRFTSIEDEVSQSVARQYEENPYPRWSTLQPVKMKPVPVGAYLRERFPAVPVRLNKGETCEYLIAGCGTGQHAALVARIYSGVRVTAVDLSRASLGYAKYQSDKLGLTGISYGQADIMALGGLDRSFDVIDSSGVLHHMASPEAGWRVLLGLLQPTGCMRIALYSEIARRHVVAVRRMIAERGYGQTAEDIRRCRHELVSLPVDAPERQPTNFRDFYSLSECRDLLFHAQEHRMTFPWIAQFLKDHGLEMIGLEVGAPTQDKYRSRFPNDKPMTDLNNWHVFEQENPDLFLYMYQFWVQRCR